MAESSPALHIPVSATAAAARVSADGGRVHDLLVAAAPSIVAAELQRLAEAYLFTHGMRSDEMVRRADELTGGLLGEPAATETAAELAGRDGDTTHA